MTVDMLRLCGMMADVSQLCGVTANALRLYGVAAVALQPAWHGGGCVAVVRSNSGRNMAVQRNSGHIA
jgi:hypothetical protein